MKAILVKSCYECPYREYFDKGVICMQMGLTWTDKMDGYFPDWCPLKPMPTKKKPLFDPDHCEIEKEIKIVHEIVGYNRCIDEIMGEIE